VANRKSLLGLDLNLLPKFCALYRKRSVSEAARDLYMTQSAMSNALAKMREAFSDDLFVRTSRGMVPTPIAERMWESVAPALEAIEGGFERAQTFDAATSARHFAFGVTCEAELCVIPELFALLRGLGPKLELSTCESGKREACDDLRSRRTDFFVGAAQVASDMQSVALLEPLDVCVVRADHAAVRSADPAALSSCRFTQAASVVGLLALVASSDLAAVVPEPVASRFASAFGLAVLPNPFGVSRSNFSVCWASHRMNDAGIRWVVARLRALASLRTCASAVPA
jgi:DNA-binding transcriptional LysR family regulator